ncbi:MAG: acyl-CoA thioesterase [Actinomycetota bacterium]|nr:acyl-CoA thioesterase [Actinomycetota bacterium]
MAEAAAPYVHRLRVRYGEVDMQRVVFNAHYLAYCDDACETWLAQRGVRVLSFGWDFMLKKATIEWAGAATVHDHLDITVAVTRWGNTSFDVGFEGSVDDRAVFSCTITYVGVKAGTRETMPPPPEVRAALDA